MSKLFNYHVAEQWLKLRLYAMIAVGICCVATHRLCVGCGCAVAAALEARKSLG